MTAPAVRQRGTVIITDYPGTCRCTGPCDGRGAHGTHYTNDPKCKNNPDNQPTTNQP
jgi:hypothetical protein